MWQCGTLSEAQYTPKEDEAQLNLIVGKYAVEVVTTLVPRERVHMKTARILEEAGGTTASNGLEPRSP